MSRYETTFILAPGMDEGKVNEEIEKVSVWIKELGGEIVEVQRWGKRRLAYEINRKRDGIYTLMIYDGGGDLVKEVERRMRLNEAVLRVLTVLHVAPEPPQPDAEGEGAGTANAADRAAVTKTEAGTAAAATTATEATKTEAGTAAAATTATEATKTEAGITAAATTATEATKTEAGSSAAATTATEATKTEAGSSAAATTATEATKE